MRASSQSSFIRAVRYGLYFPVFLLKLALHFEIDLTFALEALLLHVTDHTLVHSLCRLSVTLFVIPLLTKGRTHGFVGDLLVVDEVHDSNGSQDGTC